MNRPLPVFAAAQFCMSLSWVVYAVFLPALAEHAGLPKSAVPWLLMIDQGVFFVADLAAGVAADRAQARMARYARTLGVMIALAAAALLVVPLAGASSALLVGCALVWVACSAAMRAPLFALVGKHAKSATGNEFRWLLIGNGVAMAMAPFLGAALKTQAPLLAFGTVAALMALCAWLVAGVVAQSAARTEDAPAPSGIGTAQVLLFFLALACAAFALQVNNAFNAGKLFGRELPSEALQWWLPVFWVGFNLAMLPKAPLAQWPATMRLPLYGLAGAAALAAAVYATAAPVQALLQAVAGACWAWFLCGAFGAANAWGSPLRQGQFAGGVHATLALASAARLSLAATQSIGELGAGAFWLPVLGWGCAGLLLAGLALTAPKTRAA